MRATFISSAPSPTAPPAHIRAHTGLRGVAALIVVAYHLRLASATAPLDAVLDVTARGYLFVDLFFVLSGFVLTYVYGRQGPIRSAALRGFFAARIARIYPLHAVTAVAMIALLPVTGGAWPSPSHLLTQATLTHAWGVNEAVRLNYPSWSISAEFFAYLAFPALLWLRFAAPRLFVVGGLLFAGGFYAYVGAEPGALSHETGLALPRCIAAFWIGMMLPGLAARIARLPSDVLSAAQAAVVGLIAVGFSCGVGDVWFALPFAALVGVTAADRGVIARWLSGRAIFALGVVSYSVYLLHVPVIRAATLAHYWAIARLGAAETPLTAAAFAGVVGVVTIAGAFAAYPLIEVRGRRWLIGALRRSTPPRAVPA